MMNLVDLAARRRPDPGARLPLRGRQHLRDAVLPASARARRRHRAPLHHQVSERPQRHGGRPAGHVARRPGRAARLHSERRGRACRGRWTAGSRCAASRRCRSACGSTTPTAGGSPSGSPRRKDVPKVYYPGLPSHPQHELACRQMSGFGGMISIDLGDPARARRVVERHQDLRARRVAGRRGEPDRSSGRP